MSDDGLIYCCFERKGHPLVAHYSWHFSPLPRNLNVSTCASLSFFLSDISVSIPAFRVHAITSVIFAFTLHLLWYASSLMHPAIPPLFSETLSLANIPKSSAYTSSHKSSFLQLHKLKIIVGPRLFSQSEYTSEIWIQVDVFNLI